MLTFTASLPPIQSAIKVSGNRDGVRIQLDVPGTDAIVAMSMALLGGQTFKVQIIPDKEEDDNG